VITLSMMVLLTIIAVGLLGLSVVTFRSSNQQNAMIVARANARMALQIAIGELQKSAGPDQRITLASSLQAGNAPANPNWTGVIDVGTSSSSTSNNNSVRWLVSGEKPLPTQTLTRSTKLNQGDALKLATYRDASGKEIDLLAPASPLANGNTTNGRFAWWIGDEGTKARIDIAKPETNATGDRQRLARSQSPLELGWDALGEDWAKLAEEDGIDKTAIVSLETGTLATEEKELPLDYFNDVTVGGHGLPVDVTAGGMKADLSLIFDRSQSTRKYGETYLGAMPSPVSWNGAQVQGFSVRNPAKFYLSDSISKTGTIPSGPNWGNLWNYANLWQSVSNQQVSMIGAHPLVESDLRFKNWLPYTNHDQGSFRRDVQHTNSPVTPVLSFFQMGFRLNSERMPPTAANAQVFYKAQIGIQPVVGLWNPYNVAIRAATYRFDWGLYPYFRFNYAKPGGNGTFSDGRLTRLWLRQEWTAGGSVIPTPDDGSAGKWLQLETPTVDLQPGEFRLFSVTDRINVRAGQTYTLKPGWSEKGAFIVDLKDDTGNVRLVPAGYRAWFGTLYLQDTQSNEVRSKFPTLDTATVASNWLTVKSGGNILSRSLEFWNGGVQSSSANDFLVPEPVISGSSGGLDTTKTTYLIDDLTGDRVTPNIATWSFFLRTTNQVEAPDANQALRGWVDCNPRALVTNSIWDGSKISNSGDRSGWHTASPFIGAWNAPGRPRVVGDGRGGNRGLLAEGGSAPSEPEVNRAGGRYQGYGGASNTLAGGRTHVITYDVPRSPLVSIGQFQHAQVSRYNFEPGFVVGNSYANPRIPLGATTNPNFGGTSGLTISDVSHELNRKLWDGYFFSTMSPDYVGGTGTSLDRFFDMRKLASGETILPNPRMTFSPQPGDVKIDTILSSAADRAPQALAARILIKGAFNVNSTSKTAWKAVLASMGRSELPVIDPTSATLSWENPDGIRFNRFGHVLTSEPYRKGDAGDEDGFWQGWRSLSNDELDKLAEEIVREVKERGPFRSMAEFVNRNPSGSKVEHQLKGPLQAALDRTINSEFPTSVGKPAMKPPGSHFSNAMAGESTAAGQASYLMQGDLLQSLAPILQVRSDYFRIRTCGEALDASGNVIARAWCEAFVQRSAGYVDPADSAHRNPSELSSRANKTFGRRFEVVSFRWLSPNEI
jgi:hypothetical protein